MLFHRTVIWITKFFGLQNQKLSLNQKRNLQLYFYNLKLFKISFTKLYEAISIEESDRQPNRSLTRILLMFICLSSLWHIIFSSALENEVIIEIGL